MAWLSRAALECIGQGAIGYTCEAVDENKVNHYNEAVKMLMWVKYNQFTSSDVV